MNFAIRALTGVGVVLLLSADASAGWNARATELKERLSKAQLETDKERELLEKAVYEWLKTRDECFNQLVKIIADETPGDQDRAWRALLETTRSEIDVFNEAVKSIPGAPSVAAFHFAATTAAEEEKMLAALSAVRVGKARDEIIANQKHVSEMAGILDEKWNRLFDEDNRLDEHEKRVADEMWNLIVQVAHETAELNRTTREKVAKWAEVVIDVSKVAAEVGGNVMNDPVAGEAAGKILDGLKERLNRWLAMNQQLLSRLAAYNSMVGSESGGIYVLFGGFRRDTQDFIQRNGFGVAKETFGKAETSMRDAASAAVTSGQRSDVDALSREVLSRLSAHLERTKNVHDEFVKRNESKFFGPVGPSIKEALVEYRVWEDYERNLGRVDLDRQLQAFRDQRNNFWDVNLSGITEEQKEQLKRTIRQTLDEIARTHEETLRLKKELEGAVKRDRMDDELDRS